MKTCEHRNIIVVIEQPKDKEGNIYPYKYSVQCEDCRAILPINRIVIEKKTIEYKDINLAYL